MAKKGEWCFAWYARPAFAPGADRAALQRDAKWQAGYVITVSFLDGDPAVHAKVRQFARQWTEPGLARLMLSFRSDTTDTDIRISFRYPGSWSTIGTTCRNVPGNEPTMNYGWLTPSTPDDEVRRVVLHEFGHALGLIHEHQHPAHGIQWRRDQVIADLSGPPNNWDLATIEFNMFQPAAAAEHNFSTFDPESIMMYPIPPNWTTNGASVGLNTDLSATDRQFIHQRYL
jgi:hypothetical protein